MSDPTECVLDFLPVGPSAGYTVILAHRDEPDLDATLANIRETQHGYNELLPVCDTTKAGCGRTRHAGIGKATTEIVIVCDPHMRFEEGALDGLALYIAEHPHDVATLQCCFNEANEIGKSPANPGAELYEFGDHKIFEPKWQYDKADAAELVVCSCLMGGVYAFTKTHYADMGQPLAFLEKWGGDEEVLSVATWMLGGRVVCLPKKCSHLYRGSRTWPGMEGRDFERAKLRNAQALVTYFGIAEPLKGRLLEHQRAFAIKTGIADRANGAMRINAGVAEAGCVLAERRKFTYEEVRIALFTEYMTPPRVTAIPTMPTLPKATTTTPAAEVQEEAHLSPKMMICPNCGSTSRMPYARTLYGRLRYTCPRCLQEVIDYGK